MRRDGGGQGITPPLGVRCTLSTHIGGSAYHGESGPAQRGFLSRVGTYFWPCLGGKGVKKAKSAPLSGSILAAIRTNSIWKDFRSMIPYSYRANQQMAGLRATISAIQTATVSLSPGRTPSPVTWCFTRRTPTWAQWAVGTRTDSYSLSIVPAVITTW